MAKISKSTVLYARLNTPTLVKLEIDFTEGAKSNIPAEFTGRALKGALVRPTIRYRESDVERVERELRSMIESVSGLARHVFPTVKEIIRTEKCRDRTMQRDLSPVLAFGSWLDARFVESKELGREELEKIFQSLVEKTQSQPQPMLAAGKFLVKKIGVEDYIPFRGTNEVVGLAKGVYGVVGIYTQNHRRSNRAGKSALLKAILTALFGEDRSELGRGESFERDIHHGASKSRVALELEVDGDKKVEIVRERTRDARPLVILNGASTSVTDTEKCLRTVLKFEREDFVRIAFIRSGDLRGILSLGNTEMKSGLLRWLGLEYWEDLAKAIEPEISELLAKRSLLEGRQIGLVEAMNLLSANGKMENLKADLAMWKSKQDEKQKRIDWLNAELAKTKLSADKVYEKQSIQRLRQEFQKLGKDCERKFNGVLYTDPNELVLALDKEIQICEKELRFAREANAGFEAVVEEKERVDQAFVESGRCPLDAVLCPRRGAILDGVSARKNARQESMAKRAAKDDRDYEIRQLEKKLWAAKAEYKEAKARSDRYYTTRNQIDVLKQEVEEVDESSLTRKVQIEREIRQAWQDLEAIHSEIAGIQNREEQFKTSVEKFQEQEARIKGLEIQIRRMRFVKTAVSRSGIPALQLENALGEIEVGANRVLELIEAPHRMEFSFQKELKTFESECGACGRPFKNGKKCEVCGAVRQPKKSEELSVVITDSNGRRQAFEQDSDGGQSLVALAVRISLAQLFGFNVLFLDEVCGSLDEENLDMLIRLLAKLPDLGIDQVFLISHRQRVMEMLENLILVERNSDEGWSRVFLRD